MKKLLIVAILTAGSVAAGFAQSGKVITAFNLFSAYQQNNKDKQSLEDAYAAINDATKFESTSQENKTWYYKGFICQLIYQDSILNIKYPSALWEAEEAYEKVITLSEEPNGNKKKFVEDSYGNLGILAGQLHNSGIVAFEKKDYTTAYKDFTDVMAVNDFMTKRNQQDKVKVKLENTYYLAALSASGLKKMEDAKTYFKKLVDLKYKNIYIYEALATIYENEKDQQKAMDILDLGMKEYPDSSSLLIDKLNIYLGTGRSTEAMDLMKKAIQLDPKNPQLYFVLGRTYTTMRDTAAAHKDENTALDDENNAIENYKKAIEVDPKFGEAYHNLGAIYLDRANALVDKMADPKIKDEDYQKLDQQRMDLLKQGLPYLEKASEMEPKDIGILSALKTIYAKMGDYDKVNEVKKRIDALQAK